MVSYRGSVGQACRPRCSLAQVASKFARAWRDGFGLRQTGHGALAAPRFLARLGDCEADLGSEIVAGAAVD
jgi:hypothetical protein